MCGTQAQLIMYINMLDILEVAILKIKTKRDTSERVREMVVVLRPLFLQLLLVLLAGMAATESSNVLLPRCQDSCGNLSIPYPFGISPGCFREGFEITCREDRYGYPKPFYGGVNSSLAAIDISLLQGQARVHKHLSYACYNESGLPYRWNLSPMYLGDLPYTISATRNRFTAIGCDTLAYISGNYGQSYGSGCVAVCNSPDYALSGSCMGTGCCQTSIPQNLFSFNSRFDKNFNHSRVYTFNPCIYAFIADDEWFTFNVSDLSGYTFLEKHIDGVPLVLEWVVGNETCDKANKSSSYACCSNSVCIDKPNGYICNCSVGYEGNPYLENGCQDIDECKHLDKFPCLGVCVNKEGSYDCSCSPGQHGTDPKSRSCEPNPSPGRLPLWTKLALGIGIGFVFLLVLSFWLYVESEKRKLNKEKERFFKQNGGLLLYEKIKSEGYHRGGAAFKIFGKEEMEKATNNFDKSLILGRGGHGTVYRGMLDGNITVAIKKSRMIDESQKEEFVKEILILSQINHKNVVKLLGCCLEVEVPMLVYEFVFNGTLYEYLHTKNLTHSIPLDNLLRIATDSAEALAYLHSSASPPILHGDVKSANILLDENYAAKVSDFGASTLVSMDETESATILQGTCGYLDPEYVQTYIFTEKSDVYSFGVVLLEIFTRKKVFYFDGTNVKRCLVSTFLSLLEKSQFMEFFYDGHRLKNEEHAELVSEVATLAKECLNLKGEERPTMKEVAERLNRMRKFSQHPWGQSNPEELEILISESSSSFARDSTGYHSLKAMSSLNTKADL